MKVIFLDIDGVLNGDYMYDLTKNRPNCQGYLGIGSCHLNCLAWLLSQTDRPDIVLVSSWKYEYDDYIKNGYQNRIGRYLRQKLKKRGMHIKSTTTMYDKLSGMGRGNEIHRYLEDHPQVDKWVVLDDEVFMDYDDEIMNHLVRTDYMEGLTIEDCKKAIDILNK